MAFFVVPVPSTMAVQMKEITCCLLTPLAYFYNWSSWLLSGLNMHWMIAKMTTTESATTRRPQLLARR
jgi:hypothetical protein